MTPTERYGYLTGYLQKQSAEDSNALETLALGGDKVIGAGMRQIGRAALHPWDSLKDIASQASKVPGNYHKLVYDTVMNWDKIKGAAEKYGKPVWRAQNEALKKGFADTFVDDAGKVQPLGTPEMRDHAVGQAADMAELAVPLLAPYSVPGVLSANAYADSLINLISPKKGEARAQSMLKPVPEKPHSGGGLLSLGAKGYNATIRALRPVSSVRAQASDDNAAGVLAENAEQDWKNVKTEAGGLADALRKNVGTAAGAIGDRLGKKPYVKPDDTPPTGGYAMYGGN